LVGASSIDGNIYGNTAFNAAAQAVASAILLSPTPCMFKSMVPGTAHPILLVTSLFTTKTVLVLGGGEVV
jgi:hypothetical protein